MTCINYLAYCFLTMLIDLIVFGNQGTNLVNVLQKVGASTLIQKSENCDSAILSADGDSVGAFDRDFSNQTTFDRLQFEYTFVEVSLGEDLEPLL